MATRTLSEPIHSPSTQPREGLRVDFHADDPAYSTHAVTDAGGVFVVELEVGMTYRVPVQNAVIVNGVTWPAGTVFVATVPEGEGPVDLATVTVGAIDASLPALLTRLDALQSAHDALTARVAALEGI